MALADIPRCPRCGHQVNPEDLRREYGRRRTVLNRTQWGIRCPDCKFVSKIRKTRAHIVSFTLFASAAAVGASLKDPSRGLSADMQLIAFIVLVAIVVFVQVRWAPLLVQLEDPAPGELLRPSRAIDEEMTDDPHYREDCEAAEEQNRWIEAVNDPERKPWRCSSCGEQNPATFDVCWNCQKPNESQQAS